MKSHFCKHIQKGLQLCLNLSYRVNLIFIFVEINRSRKSPAKQYYTIVVLSKNCQMRRAMWSWWKTTFIRSFSSHFPADISVLWHRKQHYLFQQEELISGEQLSSAKTNKFSIGLMLLLTCLTFFWNRGVWISVLFLCGTFHNWYPLKWVLSSIFAINDSH